LIQNQLLSCSLQLVDPMSLLLRCSLLLVATKDLLPLHWLPAVVVVLPMDLPSWLPHFGYYPDEWLLSFS
jgi:hypothetical protein